MKKISIVFGLLLLIVLVFKFRTKDNTLDKTLSDFAVEDTSSITKVFLADKYDHTVVLNKVENEWFVEGKYPIRKDALEYLLSTIKNVRVRHPVSNSLHDKIVKNLATSSVKIEIFTNDHKNAHKSYYIGGESKDMIGSYMLLENSNRAFVVYLPGFNGFLAPRYNIDGTVVNSDLWRDRTIYNLKAEEIAFINITNHTDTLASFKMERSDNQYFYTKENVTKSISKKNGETYFSLFNQVYCEGFMNDFSKKDSIFSSEPLYTIEVRLINNQELKLYCYQKQSDQFNYSSLNNNELTYDTDRMYAKLNDDLVLIQYYIFDKILLRSPNFSVEK